MSEYLKFLFALLSTDKEKRLERQIYCEKNTSLLLQFFYNLSATIRSVMIIVFTFRNVIKI